MIEYPKFCYKYVAQPSLDKRNEFCLRIFRKIKKSSKYPKVEIRLMDTRSSLFVRSHLLLHFIPKII